MCEPNCKSILPSSWHQDEGHCHNFMKKCKNTVVQDSSIHAHCYKVISFVHKILSKNQNQNHTSLSFLHLPKIY